MRKYLIALLTLTVLLCAGLASAASTVPLKTASDKAADQEKPAPPDGCSPAFRAIFNNAKVVIKGKGKGDIVVVTDPLCWHCRLGHKLLHEYSDLWGTLRLFFFPRRQFIGSDMAAWIMLDNVGTDREQAMVDFAYEGLRQPKTDDIIEARMIVLKQFTDVFTDMLKGTTLDKLYLRLQKAHEMEVMESTSLGQAANIPGTPTLIAGSSVVIGFGPGVWVKTLKEMQLCK